MLAAAKALNAGLGFVLELAVLASLGVWGFGLEGRALRWIAGVGAPLLFIVIWGLFGSPNKPMVQLTGAPRIAFEVFWFGSGIVALAASGRRTLALGFAVIFAIHTVLLRVWQQQP